MSLSKNTSIVLAISMDFIIGMNFIFVDFIDV